MILAGAAFGIGIGGRSRLTENCQGFVQSLQGMLDLTGSSFPLFCFICIDSFSYFVGGIQA